MKPQSILAATVVGAASIVSAQTIATTAPASTAYTKITADIASYESSAAGALPLSLANDIASFAQTANAGIFTTYSAWPQYASDLNAAVTGTPAWLQGAPTQVISYVKSVASAEASIINKNTSGASKVDGALNVAIVGVVAVAAGIALIL